MGTGDTPGLGEQVGMRRMTPEQIADRANRKQWDKFRNSVIPKMTDQSASIEERYQAYGDYRSANLAGNTEAHPNLPQSKEKLSLEEFQEWVKKDQEIDAAATARTVELAATSKARKEARAAAMVERLKKEAAEETEMRPIIARDKNKDEHIWEASELAAMMKRPEIAAKMPVKSAELRPVRSFWENVRNMGTDIGNMFKGNKAK